MTTFTVALIASVVLVGVVRALMLRAGVMDVPNHRSSHVRPVPRGGGLAIVPSAALGIAAAQCWSTPVVVVVVGAAALGVVGLVDDVRDVAASMRLVAQLGLTGAIAAALLSSVSSLSGVLLAVACALSLVWLSGFVNIYNFMDGANGVAALMAIIAGGWFAYLGGDRDVDVLTVLGLGLFGAALGFLPWNFPRARVFLGDVGSYSIGCTIGCLALVAMVATHSVVLSVAPAVVFITDATLTLVRRAARRQPVMSAHREHVYQRLTTRAGSALPAVATTVASLVCVLAAAVLPWALCVVAWTVVLAGYVSLPAWVTRRVNQRSS